jgi:hypothetical protein
MKKLYTIVENKAVFELLKKLALELVAKNPKACVNTKWLTEDSFDTHTIFACYPKDGGFFWSKGDENSLSIFKAQGASKISLAEMISFIQNFNNQVAVIPLSQDYSAEVSAANVKVGCQTIPFGTVEKIYQTMLEKRKQ